MTRQFRCWPQDWAKPKRDGCGRTCAMIVPQQTAHQLRCGSRIHRIARANICQFRLKIPRCTGQKFPTRKLHEWASLGSDGVEPSAGFWRVLGVTESEAKEDGYAGFD